MNHHVECTVPVLPVENLERSIEFYRSLGFQLDWGGGEGSLICSVSHDGCPLMLSQGVTPGSAPQCVWIGVKDEQLFQAWRTLGVKVVQEPKNWVWAYEMKFADIDGNVLWLGTSPRADE